MSIIFADPGGEYYFSLGISGAETAGIWTSDVSASLVSTATAGRQAASDGKVYAIQLGGFNNVVEKVFPANYSHLIVGWAVYVPTAPTSNNQIIFAFKDGTSTQTDARTDASGHVFLTRNGTTIGSASSATLAAGWNYFEIETTFTTGATGSATFWANGIQLVTVSSVQTASSGNAFANRIRIGQVTGVTNNNYVKDIYVLDAATSPNNTRLGDVTIAALFPNGAGVNSQFAANVGPFTLTSVNGSGVFQGTITGGGSNAYVGFNFVVTGFVNGANNITAKCTASTTTALTLSATTTTETHSGSAAFQCIVQDGINHLGTWPDGDVTYAADSTTNDISDFAHEALTLAGTIFGKVHVSYVRKDDAGARAFRQVTLSGGTTHTNGADLGATNTYLYYLDYMDVDPNTSSAWTLTNLNNSTDGVKEIT